MARIAALAGFYAALACLFAAIVFFWRRPRPYYALLVGAGGGLLLEAFALRNLVLAVIACVFAVGSTWARCYFASWGQR